MSFGFSVGDFLTISKLATELLGEVDGASGEFKALVPRLRSVEIALKQVAELDLNSSQYGDRLAVIQSMTAQCRVSVDDFYHEAMELYPRRKEGESFPAFRSAWRRRKWAAFQKDEVPRFSERLGAYMQSLQVLLAIAAMGNLQIANLENNSEVVSSYRRLDYENYEIRILTISGDSDDMPLTATLEYTSLMDAGAYTALSYCWGDPKVTTPIVIDGIFVPVTVNLKAALLRLRARGYHRVWVDAVCINQVDREERSLQVRNMRQIFSRAVQVVCWIGESSLEVAEAARQSFKDRYKLILERNVDPLPNLDALIDFFSRPYWNRVWIIQEVAVAIDVKVLFGCIELPWSSISDVLTSYERIEGLELQESLLTGALALANFRHNLSVSPESVGLFQALQRSSKSLATDPRDKIFALLGVSHDGPRLVPLPNYKQSLQDILNDMTVAIIRESRSLDIICLRGGEPVSDKSKPSWVPDWLHLWDPDRPLPYLEAHFTDWTTIHSRNPLIRRIDNGSIMVRGLFLGTISKLSTMMENDENAAGAGLPPVESVIQGMQFRDNDSRYTDRLWQTLCMMEVQTKPSLRIHIADRTKRSFFEMLRLASLSERQIGDFTASTRFLQWLQKNLPASFEGDKPQDWTIPHEYAIDRPSFLAQLPSYLHSLEGLASHIENVLQSGMRLMSTTESWVGMAHPQARVGDRMMYLQGCSVPIILRGVEAPGVAKPEAFAVVGGAYLHSSHANYSACCQFVKDGHWKWRSEVEEVVLR